MEQSRIDNGFNQTEQENLMNRLYLSEEDRKGAYEKLTRNWINMDELGVQELERGIILPVRGRSGGVCTEDFDFVAGHLEKKPIPGQNVSSLPLVSSSYTVPRNEIEFVNETVVFGGVMQDHPGHQIVEGIANRMWWHIRNPELKLRFAFATMWGNDYFVKEFLDLLGVPEYRILFITKPTQFAKILVPDQAIYYYDSFQQQEYMSVMNHIKNNVEIGPPKKYFFRKNSKNDMVNQEYFAQFYAKKGFEIIDPENYSLREKVSMMRGAKEVAAIGGTNLLYTVFCEPDTKIFLLGRANDPVADHYVHYNVAGIKDMYVIDVGLSFLHKDRIWGVNLLGATKYWAQFVQDYYHEQIEETEESVLKEFSYEYMKRCAENYSEVEYVRKHGILESAPHNFNSFNGFSHFQIIDLMNQVLLGRKLDPSKYPPDAPELRLQYKYISNALHFCIELCLDFLGERKFERFMWSLAGKNVAVLKSRDEAGIIFLKACESVGANVILNSEMVTLQQCTEAEMDCARRAEAVITCCVHGTRTHERDRVKCIDIWDILRDDSLTKDLPAVPEASSETLSAIANEAKRAKEICEHIERLAQEADGASNS